MKGKEKYTVDFEKISTDVKHYPKGNGTYW